MARTERFGQERVCEYQDAECVFLEGDMTREMFVIQSGSVEIVRQGIILRVLERGAMFGEMALLESLPRSADARAKGVTRLVEIKPGGFLLKVRRDPTFAFELLRQVSSRLRTTSDRLVRAVGTEQVLAEDSQVENLP
jgi:CRP/FNR family transcriptional regulator, cyclic AMP receptor protein